MLQIEMRLDLIYVPSVFQEEQFPECIYWLVYSSFNVQYILAGIQNVTCMCLVISNARQSFVKIFIVCTIHTFRLCRLIRRSDGRLRPRHFDRVPAIRGCGRGRVRGCPDVGTTHDKTVSTNDVQVVDFCNHSDSELSWINSRIGFQNYSQTPENYSRIDDNCSGIGRE